MNETVDLYEERCVLFLDILGFSDHIKNGREADIYEALKFEDDPVSKIFLESVDGGLQVSAFSDSIVVSNTTATESSIGGMIILANYLALKLLSKGMLSRGGMAVGKMHHKNGVLFGPAMLEAYQLEQRIAFYPRIVLSAELVNRNNELFNDDGLFVRRANDGIFFIHILGSGAPYPKEFRPEGDYSIAEFRAKALEVAKTPLKHRPIDARAALKHDWFQNYIHVTEAEEVSGSDYKSVQDFFENILTLDGDG